MEDFLSNIKKYDPDINEEAANKIAKDLRLVMHDNDARYVATSDASELELVMKNFALRKLNVTLDEAKEAVHKVAELMKGENHKSRITFYYLVAKELGKLSALYE